ncbi:NuoF family protein [Oceanirhabdus sp. W0125-5]|uniref:NuoF family protein n=1 Tax=Oceanirhabdus sp. W0125-5 TaxID=2999116 RepID=UPI0022F2BD92|nr:NuoF family protein [Oceanirhabdus sp. W0125-5]WBW95618.1 NADH-ubiquinone oxidoreductase-F iron-sulfur binding region domain-containing protein [Oceanirhabdus sp. W0125-5]
MINVLIKEWADLENIKEKSIVKQRLNKDGKRARITVHMSTCGIASGANDVVNSFRSLLKETKEKNIEIKTTGCIGICSKEPLITVEIADQEPIIYENVNEEKAKQIFHSHVKNGDILSEYAFVRGKESEIEERMNNGGGIPGQQAVNNPIKAIEEVPFFNLQKRIVVRNRGAIDPYKIDDYIARDGYKAVYKALREMDSSNIIDTILESGLRGRGGAGFPTGLKWNFASKAQTDDKYVICNADEGDPGAYMDRSVLEGDPHSIIEGMIIAARAINATKGFIYCRAEYPLAVEILSKALSQARAYGLLGNNILGTNFSFDIEVYEGAGAFVCGEETALIHSIEGKRGNPRLKIPYPVEKGAFNKPTLINNVETLANIAPIIINGSQWFAEIGTEKSKGTKVFSITGDIVNVGCVEVPIGTSIRTVIEDIACIAEGDKNIKAVQLGGPSGGCLPAEYFDTVLDYESLQQLGTIMGSGGMIVMNDDKSVVDLARFFMQFCESESCGKCIPCREGTRQMVNILNKICQGNGKKEDIDNLEDLANVVIKSSLCGLGKTASNPVLSTLNYFRNDYEALVK